MGGSHGSALEQRMIGEHRRALEGKNRGEVFEQPLAHKGRTKRTPSFAHQGGHGFQLLRITADDAEWEQVRIDVQHRAEVSDPIPDGHADTRYLSSPDPNT